jgi:hypothetical protein
MFGRCSAFCRAGASARRRHFPQHIIRSGRRFADLQPMLAVLDDHKWAESFASLNEPRRIVARRRTGGGAAIRCSYEGNADRQQAGAAGDNLKARRPGCVHKTSAADPQHSGHVTVGWALNLSDKGGRNAISSVQQKCLRVPAVLMVTPTWRRLRWRFPFDGECRHQDEASRSHLLCLR